jgi:DNA repair exonuclease SbcCD ATPase subunit
MKITRLKLVNFIGIKHGTGLDEIEIDFTKGKNRLVMLVGGNGSGKSTILSQLHPFKNSFDERKNLIMDGLEGIKEIDIEHEGDKYEIKHIYNPGKAQSFVKKNGTEMNDNGGVKTFDSFIETELGVNSDYFKIGKIGSNTSNFIEFTTSERKVYISKFLPHIEDYLEKFEIVKEKFRILSADIKTISSDLGKLEPEETVKSRIDTLNTLMKSLEDEIEKVSNNAAVFQSDINNYTAEIAAINFPELLMEKSEKEKLKKEIILKGEEFNKKYNDKKDFEYLRQFIADKAKVVKALSEEVAVLSTKKTGVNESIISAQNDISKLEFNIKGIDIKDTIESLDAKTEEVKGKIKALEKRKEKKLFEIVKNNHRDISLQLAKFETFSNFVIKYFNDLNKNSVNPKKSNIEVFLEDDFVSNIETQNASIRTLIQEKQNLLNTNRGLVAQKNESLKKFKEIYKENNIKSVDELEACRNCPFAKDAMEYQKLPAEIQKLESVISQIQKDLNEYEIKANNLIEIKMLYQNFKSQFEQMGPRTNVVYSYFINDYGTIGQMIKGSINDFTNAVNELTEEIGSAIFDIQTLSTLETELQNIEYKKNTIKNNDKIRKQYEDNIKEKQDTVSTLKDNLKVLSKEYQEKSKLLETETIVLDDYTAFEEGKRNINSLSTQLSNLNAQEKNYTEKSQAIKTKGELLIVENQKLSELKSRKVTSNTDLMRTQSLLSSITTLKEKQKALENDYNAMKSIRDALDPNKGIPLYFIKSYLEKTKDITNELLNLAFNGNFEISFLTNASDFFIQVRAGENVKNDIKEASQGEVALTTISISLALIEQAIGKFNILALDEIDGPLDSSNRENFISILNKQIEKLGMEQIFVISHNNAFDMEPMDLIVLKGANINKDDSTFMTNKEVIFEL